MRPCANINVVNYFSSLEIHISGCSIMMCHSAKMSELLDSGAKINHHLFTVHISIFIDKQSTDRHVAIVASTIDITRSCSMVRTWCLHKLLLCKFFTALQLCDGNVHLLLAKHIIFYFVRLFFAGFHLTYLHSLAEIHIFH